MIKSIKILFSKIFYFVVYHSIVGFSVIKKLKWNNLILIFGILKFGILIYGILKNIFCLDVLYFPSDSSLNYDNLDPNSEPTSGPSGPTGLTGPLDPKDFKDYIYNLPPNLPTEEDLDEIWGEIHRGELQRLPLFTRPYSDYVDREELCHHFFGRQGKFVALDVGLVENSEHFNQFINLYRVRNLDLWKFKNIILHIRTFA